MPSGSVLVIEDDDDIRESVRLFLEEEGYTVVEARDGVIGLALLRQSSHAMVVLVDYRMPRMDGIALLAEVAKQPHLARQHVYLLITANYDQLPPDSAQLLAALSVGMVRKPFDLDLLLRAVARAQALLPRHRTSRTSAGHRTTAAPASSTGSCRAH